MTELPHDRERHVLSAEENARIFHEQLAPELYGDLERVAHPSAHFFCGPPGAGKSALQPKVRDQLIAADGPHSVMRIIGDEFRSYHPRFARLLEQDDIRAAFYTDIDLLRWVEQSTALSYDLKPHVITENTFRDPTPTLTAAREYRQRGFNVELHLIVVHEFISRYRIIARYFEQRGKAKLARYTLRDVHDRSYQALPDSIAAAAQANVFDRITLYNEEGVELLSVAHDEEDMEERLRQVVDRQRNLESVDMPYLLGSLVRYASLLGEHEQAELVDDMAGLREEMERAHVN